MNTQADQTDLFLELKDLESDSFGLTPNTGGGLAEAASVCLKSQGHELEGSMKQVGTFADIRTAFRRLKVNRNMQQSHKDRDEATKDGAEGIALLLMIRTGKAKEFSRARKAGGDGPAAGFDFWFVSNPTDGFVFDNPSAGRLEGSGIRNSTDSQVKARLKEKVDQTKKSDEELGDRPTYAIVVELSTPQIWAEKR